MYDYGEERKVLWIISWWGIIHNWRNANLDFLSPPPSCSLTLSFLYFVSTRELIVSLHLHLLIVDEEEKLYVALYLKVWFFL